MRQYFNSNPTLTLSLITVIACVARFVFDGISFTVFGHPVNIPHTDPLAYGSILAPVLGAHGYVQTRRNYNHREVYRGKEVDNPDGN